MRASWCRRNKSSLHFATLVLLLIYSWSIFQTDHHAQEIQVVENSYKFSSKFETLGSRRILGLESNDMQPTKEGFKSSLSVLLRTRKKKSSHSMIKILGKNVTLLQRRSLDDSCGEIKQHKGYASACEFVRAHQKCRMGGLIEYIYIFYCNCGHSPGLGYLLLALWLIALFYMLGNTAEDYFCFSLEKLSKLLHLHPTVAGVTLLPFGNGAPDVAASIMAFAGAGVAELGLNSVLGGAVFLVTVVAGSVSLVSTGSAVHLDRWCFIRDLSFFLVAVAVLGIVLIIGKINFWGSVAFTLIYLVYACFVAASHFLKRSSGELEWDVIQPLLSHQRSIGSHEKNIVKKVVKKFEKNDECSTTSDRALQRTASTTSLNQWMWISQVSILPEQAEKCCPLLGSFEEQIDASKPSKLWYVLQKLFKILVEWPLTLPRQLTIPILEEDRWSRPSAVTSAFLAPISLALLWCLIDGKPITQDWYLLIGGSFGGLLLGLVALLTTESEHPPRHQLPWVLAGFFMSIVWFYLIAEELVAALVSLGIILDIDPAILGLTVLAWGNSMGDLMGNIAIACHDQGDGVQIAMSGCYAGAMFNTLVGLGLSLIFASWQTYPAAFSVPEDNSLFYTLGFLVAALVWALAVLPANRMRPTRLLGIGQFLLYGLFLALRFCSAMGYISLTGL